MNIHHHSFCVNRFFIFFQKFFTFFPVFFPGDFPRFPAHSLRGGRLLSVTGGRGGFPRPAGAGRGARRRGAHGRRMMTRGIGAARSVPRRPCRGWRSCPQPERTAMQSEGLPCPAGWPRHGRRGMEPDGGTAQSPEHAGSRHIKTQPRQSGKFLSLRSAGALGLPAFDFHGQSSCRLRPGLSPAAKLSAGDFRNSSLRF